MATSAASIDTLHRPVYSFEPIHGHATVTRHEIDCVTKDEALGPYERIVSVGGPTLPGVVPPDTSSVVAGLQRRGLTVSARSRWRLPTNEAIDGILHGKWTFYIQFGVYDVVNVEVATAPSGRSYLKTQVDQDAPDELLCLPQCW